MKLSSFTWFHLPKVKKSHPNFEDQGRSVGLVLGYESSVSKIRLINFKNSIPLGYIMLLIRNYATHPNTTAVIVVLVTSPKGLDGKYFQCVWWEIRR